MSTKILSAYTLVLASLVFAPSSIADTIDDELKAIEMNRRNQANSNIPQAPISKSKEADMVEPMSMNLFRGRSDGWWQAIVKMSNGVKISVNSEFTTIYGSWRVIDTKGNSVFIQKGSDKSTIRQLFVDMQDDSGGRSTSTTFSNGGVQPLLMSPTSIPVPPL